MGMPLAANGSHYGVGGMKWAPYGVESDGTTSDQMGMNHLGFGWDMSLNGDNNWRGSNVGCTNIWGNLPHQGDIGGGMESDIGLPPGLVGDHNDGNDAGLPPGLF